MKLSPKYLISIAGALLIAGTSQAQNFIKTDLALSFLGNKKLVQTFDFNLNRTDEVQNNSSGVYFLYTHKYYIVPTVDANIGESVSAANNNIVTQVTFGKVLGDVKRKSGMDIANTRFSAEISPTYNSDKTFAEKLYYAQFKFIYNPIFDHFGGPADNPELQREISIAIDPIFNLGTHDSKIYQTEQGYSAAGLNTSFLLRYIDKDKKGAIHDDWVFKVSADGYRLFSEIRALYAKDYYGQLVLSVDKWVTSKISLSLAYKYGNENAKYSSVNTLTFGFKYKY